MKLLRPLLAALIALVFVSPVRAGTVGLYPLASTPYTGSELLFGNRGPTTLSFAMADVANYVTGRLTFGTAAYQNIGQSGGTIPLLNTGNIWGGKQTFELGTTAEAPINCPLGAAPTSPTDGDLWCTTSGVFARINGVTQTLASTTGNVTSFNSRTGVVSLSSGDVTGALGFTPIGTASPAFTGNPTAPTATAGDNDTSIATTAFVAASFAPLASPTLTGTPAAPTPTAGDSSTKIATTAYVATSYLSSAAASSTYLTQSSATSTYAPKASPAFTGSVPTSGGTALVLTTDSRFGGVTQLSKSANYTFISTDCGNQLYHPSADTTARTATVPANASVPLQVGCKIDLFNDCSAGVLTIAITSDTLAWFPAGTTGSRALAACGHATLSKVTSTRWVIDGLGLSLNTLDRPVWAANDNLIHVDLRDMAA